MVAQGALQGGAELVGGGIGRMLRPKLARTISKLYYADGLGAHDNNLLESVFNDIAKTENLAGNRTTSVGQFLKLLSTTKKNIGLEVDTAMLNKVIRNGKLIPLGDAEIVPTQVADRLNSLTKSHPSEAEPNPAKNEDVQEPGLALSKAAHVQVAH
jgi:hypothetical protein